ncbi:RHO GTPASE-ACTIVATING PROTEIN 3 [Salix purpurea]|uniref:RHO GTPASE-ACTIVATING PROTEIN 3 n=1 Tax=Salix purpurea TaxID=77065 RepID=A0A9Q0P1H7_SALPP|nr:RHO GTPASE-ACTIVATING PROTEIN 3 [Salix purpurea]
MARLFRSKSCGLVGLTELNSAPPPAPFFHRNETEDEDEDDEEEELYSDATGNPISTPFIGSREGTGGSQGGRNGNGNKESAILDILVTVLRKSLVTCSVEREDVSSMDISWPTEVRHVSHVTFDRFNGFLGLPSEFEPEVTRKVPSASANVFGVSAKSMQCSHDDKGNSVPTILLMMQKRLYAGGGLKAEGIFRINAENSQEDYVRNQLNKGVVPRGIEVHCLAGLIKAWFRELPSGVLDSITPEQVMHCNTEDDCTQLVKQLPLTEAALLAWAINLMADVVEHEQYNKMNARNIAMVFAPNMTQMADPLTALIHAVQVMNLLKTLILKTLREREESSAKLTMLSTCSDSPSDNCEPCHSNLNSKEFRKISLNAGAPEIPTTGKFMRSATMNRLEPNTEENHWRFQKKSDGEEEFKSVSSSSPPLCETGTLDSGCKDEYDRGDWLSFRKGVRRLCRHPVFQLSKPVKKTRGIGIVNIRRGGGEAWA